VILKAFKYRIYPTTEQQQQIEQHFGCVRFVYNWGLETKIKHYEKNKKKISCFDLINIMVKTLKLEKSWLGDINAQSLQMSLRNLDNAFTRFFKQKARFPKFKAKHFSRPTFQCPQFVTVDFENQRIDLPKIKNIKTALSRKFKGKIKTATVSKTPTDKYFVSILVETPDKPKKKQKITDKTTVGIDLGLRHFATLSSGEKIENPHFLKKSLAKVKKAQRIVSRRNKGSKRRRKAIKCLARRHEKVTNQRNDFLHKLSHRLTHENQVRSYAVETLGVKDMMTNQHLAQGIGDVSWSRFIELLSYKCDWYGKNLIRIGRFEPSSKVCSSCGCLNRDLKDEREWRCPDCDAFHDRDVNAAINIKSFALVKQNLLTVKKNKIGSEGPESTLRESVSLETSSN